MLLAFIFSPYSGELIRGAGVVHREALDFCTKSVINAWQRPCHILREGVYAHEKNDSAGDDFSRSSLLSEHACIGATNARLDQWHRDRRERRRPRQGHREDSQQRHQSGDDCGHQGRRLLSRATALRKKCTILLSLSSSLVLP